MNEKWTIEQLAVLVEMALQTAGYNGQESGRVRSLPDLRTIRYYTTIGLLDPPAEMRGRKAYYGRRHVLQLAAIKRLQSRGMTLVQVQQSMAGADDRGLARWAALPADFWDRSPSVLPKEQQPLTPDAVLAEPEAPSESRTRPDSRRHGHFWAAEPNLRQTAKSSSPDKFDQHPPRTAVHLPVAPGAELVIEGIEPRQLDQETQARLAPILENLAQALDELRRSLAQPQSKSKSGSETSS